MKTYCPASPTSIAPATAPSAVQSAEPLGERNDYDATRYAGVPKMVRDKANCEQLKPGVPRAGMWITIRYILLNIIIIMSIE